jgi:hypothetical protein
MDEYQLLLQEMTSNSYIDDTDKRVLKNVIDDLRITDLTDLKDINEKWEDQVRLEAAVVYLTGKYSNKLQVIESGAEQSEALALLGIPEKNSEGRKLIAADRAAIITTNDKVRELRIRKSVLKALNRDINNLSKIVFGRNQKLENLSINVRREMSADEKSY